MMENLKNLSRFLLDCLGLDIVRASSTHDFHSFLSLLQPHSTGFKLFRAGGEYDGGYLIPDDLDGLDGIYSPGVAESSEFEGYFLARGLKCYLADNSVSSPPIIDENIVFEKKHLGLWETESEMTLENWVLRNTPNAHNLLLQMDIEDAEWAVLTNTPDDILNRFRIVVVEFHNLHRILNVHGLGTARTTISKMLRTFEIAHVHPNNGGGYLKFRGKLLPRVIEITFIRKDRVTSLEKITGFPHELDSPNLPKLPDFQISSELFREVYGT